MIFLKNFFLRIFLKNFCSKFLLKPFNKIKLKISDKDTVPFSNRFKYFKFIVGLGQSISLIVPLHSFGAGFKFQISVPFSNRFKQFL